MMMAATAEVLERALVDHPDLARHLVELDQQAWRTADPVLLELCRLRVAMLLGCDGELRARTAAAAAAGLEEATVAALASWPTAPCFGERERACLAFCEQFVIDVAGMDDDVVSAVAAHLGDEALVEFVNALLVVEQRQRLRLAWERLLPSEGPS